jgi:hypothetical protein
VDTVQSLTQQSDNRTGGKYRNRLKALLGKEGSQLVTNCHQLKLPAIDGKKHLTDVANAETLLRLVQSVPIPKAEPIKLWLAKTGYERMPEMADPAARRLVQATRSGRTWFFAKSRSILSARLTDSASRKTSAMSGSRETIFVSALYFK